MDSQPSQTFLKKAIIGSTISSAGMRPAYTAPIFQKKNPDYRWAHPNITVHKVIRHHFYSSNNSNINTS